MTPSRNMNVFRYLALILTIFVYCLIGITTAASALPVFPTAQGFGTETPAGRGGEVYRVTNLNAEGPGSLAECVTSDGKRICIFEVSGTIDISELGSWGLMIKNPYITIAGQTAPSPGITIRGGPFIIETHDLLIQHIRFRPGDTPGSGCAGGPDNCDAVTIADYRKEEDVYNVVIDQCSLSWSIDELFSTWYPSVHDVTLSNCICAEPLHHSLHPKGAHGYGPLVGKGNTQISILRNVFAHNVQRNPLLSERSESIVANNVVYNFGTATAASAVEIKASIIGNLYIKGPNTGSVDPIYMYSAQEGSQVYVEDNFLDDIEITEASGLITITPPADILVDDPPISCDTIEIEAIHDIYESILINAGARPTDRDAVDIRIIDTVQNRSGGWIDSQTDVGGWPALSINTRTLNIPPNPHNDDDGDGYTNIEEWLFEFHSALIAERPGPPQNLQILP